VLEHVAHVAVGGEHLPVGVEVAIELLAARLVLAFQPPLDAQLVGDEQVVDDHVGRRDQQRAGVRTG
jgi:hypothetical protein